MILHVLGSNGVHPSAGRPCSSFLVEHGDTRVWIDAGHGGFGALLDVASPSDLDAFVLSHIHPDHATDFFALFHWLAFGPGGKTPLPVFLPDGATEHLAAFIRAGGEGGDHAFFHTFDFHVVTEGSQATVGDIDFHFALATHSVPTLAVRAEAGGRSLVYSSDTGLGGGVPALAEGADLFLCEATYQGPGVDKIWPYHLAAEEAGTLGREAGVARLMLTHLMPVADPARSLLEAEVTFGRTVELAVPGLETKV